MYYLINNSSDLSLGQQIAQCDTFWLLNRHRVAELVHCRGGRATELGDRRGRLVNHVVRVAHLKAEILNRAVVADLLTSNHHFELAGC